VTIIDANIFNENINVINIILFHFSGKKQHFEPAFDERYRFWMYVLKKNFQCENYIHYVTLN